MTGTEANDDFHRRKSKPVPVRGSISASVYSFGSPRVGNWMLAQAMDSTMPATFRVVIDGDIVSAVPPPGMGYKHAGTEVLIDAIGAGSIIVDPSFVERRLRTQYKSSVRVHSLLVYRQGLLGVKEAGEYMRHYARTLPLGHPVDTVRMALFASPLIPESFSRKFRKKDAKPIPRPLPTSSSHAMEQDRWQVSALDVTESKSSESQNNERKEITNDIATVSLLPYLIKKNRLLTDNDSDMVIRFEKRNDLLRDRQYADEEPVLHHDDDVKATEDMVASRRMLRSLSVVPFRVTTI